MSWEFFGLAETDKCTRCLVSPATHFTGHLTLGSHIVAAGWCRACVDEQLDSGCTQYRAIARAALEAEGWAPSVRQIVDSTIMGWCGHWVPAMGLRLRGSPSASRLVLERLERARRADELVLSPREALLAHYADCTSPQVSASQTAKGPQR